MGKYASALSFDGAVRVYNRALFQSEIQTDMNAPL